ncbi:MAG: hypothetical protein LQ345_006368, partial [Seirophora villosa]
KMVVQISFFPSRRIELKDHFQSFKGLPHRFESKAWFGETLAPRWSFRDAAGSPDAALLSFRRFIGGRGSTDVVEAGPKSSCVDGCKAIMTSEYGLEDPAPDDSLPSDGRLRPNEYRGSVLRRFSRDLVCPVAE